MHNFLDIIILALISLVLGIKLFTILGQKKGRASDDFQASGECNPGTTCAPNISKVSEVQILNKTEPETKIRAFDPTFKKESFIGNAKEAYKIILDAYANGDTRTLSELVNIEMMRKFAYSISIREDKKHKHTLTIIKSEQPSIEKISVTDDIIAEIEVRFVSEVINFVSDNDDKCISGHQSKVQKLDQIWTFSRNLRSADPTWTLIGMSNDFFS